MKIYPMTDSEELPQSTILKKGFLEEEGGRKSAMRAMSFISIIASIVFGCITIYAPVSNQANGLFITTLFLLGAFAPKALQKFAETKYPHSSSKKEI